MLTRPYYPLLASKPALQDWHPHFSGDKPERKAQKLPEGCPNGNTRKIH
jgi:hypothetical protein